MSQANFRVPGVTNKNYQAFLETTLELDRRAAELGLCGEFYFQWWDGERELVFRNGKNFLFMTGVDPESVSHEVVYAFANMVWEVGEHSSGTWMVRF